MTAVPQVQNAPAGAPTPQPTDIQARRKRGRWLLVLLALLFAAPVLIATVLNSSWVNYHPSPTRHRGELLSPVVPVMPFPIQRESSAQLGEGPWTLLLVTPAACARCAESVALLENIRTSQNRNQGRVRLELLDGAGVSVSPLWQVSAMAPDHAGTLQAAGIDPQTGGLLILDPFRNAALRYPLGFDGTDVRRDLSRLLKMTQVGKSRSEGVISG
jgi:hypothetical protein